MAMGVRSDQDRSRTLVWITVGYSLMVLSTLTAFLLIRSYGEALVAPSAVNTASLVKATAQQPDALVHVLLALAAVIVTGQILAKLCAYVGQPPVIGEVVAGILLGPSLLGSEVSALILPPSVAPVLGVIAQLGVILYMFLVGLELNAESLKHRIHTMVATSHASILTPFLLGAFLALGLYPRLSSSDVSFTNFALFLGVAMSITAFPVLARILKDRNVAHTEWGMVALSCAATDDVTAWCLLAFVVAMAKAQVGDGLFVAAGTLAYIVFMFLVIRRVLDRVVSCREAERLSRRVIAVVFVALLLSALTTEAIGIHAIFGAFLLGAVIRHDSPIALTLTRQLEHVVTILLLPAFFAFTGMRTRLDLILAPDQLLICGLIVVVATLGKFGGTFVASRLTGLDWRNAAILGTLMNTRGLVELIVLNIGLDLQVISPSLFTMMVVMALVTTIATSPVLQLLTPQTASAIPKEP